MASKFGRFLVIGLFNTGVAYGLYAFFLYLGLTYVFANFLALVVGIAVSFKTQGMFAFRNADNRLFLRFVTFWGIIYLVNIGLIGAFLKLGLNAYFAGAVAVPLTAALSFVVQNYLVFR